MNTVFVNTYLSSHIAFQTYFWYIGIGIHCWYIQLDTFHYSDKGCYCKGSSEKKYSNSNSNTNANNNNNNNINNNNNNMSVITRRDKDYANKSKNDNIMMA